MYIPHYLCSRHYYSSNHVSCWYKWLTDVIALCLCNCTSSDQQQRQEVSERQRRVTISISMAPPIMPSYPSPRAHRTRQQRERHLTTVNICPAEPCAVTADLSYSGSSCRRCDDDDDDDDSVSVCLGKDRERHRNSDNTNTGKHTPVCHAKPTCRTAWRWMF